MSTFDESQLSSENKTLDEMPHVFKEKNTENSGAVPPNDIESEAASPVIEPKSRLIVWLLRGGFALFVVGVLWFLLTPGSSQKETLPVSVAKENVSHELRTPPTLPQTDQSLALTAQQTERLRQVLSGAQNNVSNEPMLNQVAQSQAARLSASSNMLSNAGELNAPPTEGAIEDKGFGSRDEKNIASSSGNSHSTTAPTVQATHISHLPTTITQGTLLRATLETRITSDLPGMIRAVTAEDVYAEDDSQILIPRGSRLIGDYVNHINQSQNRIFVIWQRLILPNGITVQLASPGADQLGGAGILADETNRHFWQQWGTASLLSLIGTATGGGNFDHENEVITPVDEYRNALRESFRQTAQQTLHNNSTITPTLTVYHGTPIGVFIARDLDFYEALRNPHLY